MFHVKYCRVTRFRSCFVSRETFYMQKLATAVRETGFFVKTCGFAGQKSEKVKEKSPLIRAFSLSQRIFVDISRGSGRFFGISKPFDRRYPTGKARFFAERRGIRAFLSHFRPP